MSEKPQIVGVTGGALGLSALALAFGVCCVAPWAVTLLGVAGAPLREDFNRDQGFVRLLFVVDPRCPECLRGLADMGDDVLAKLPQGARKSLRRTRSSDWRHLPSRQTARRAEYRDVGILKLGAHPRVKRIFWK